MHAPALALTLIAVTAAFPLTAQQANGVPEPGRKEVTLVVASKTGEPEAAVAIGYGQPVWRESHDGELRALPGGNYTRLGIGWWTTLDTIGPLDIGGVRVEAGSYFLGLVVAPDGAFSLLVFDSGQAMKARALPASSALYRGEVKAAVRAPLSFAPGSLVTSVPRLEIGITNVPADPTSCRLSIRWGKHELSAPVTLHRLEPARPSDRAK